MSRFGAKKGKRLPGAEFTWDGDAGGEPDTAPTPLFPKYTIPHARPLKPREQHQINLYRGLRERYHEGPYYSILDTSTSSAAKRDDDSRPDFDAFHGMPSYSGKYQKKKRAIPRILGRSYVMKFFPRELWQTLQPSYKPDAAMDGYTGRSRVGIKRGFEDDEDEADDDDAKRQKGGGEEGAEGAENDDNLLDDDEEQEEEIVDDDFSDDDDEMGGDYNAEQYFDGGDDEYGDDGFGDGGGGGDEETF